MFIQAEKIGNQWALKNQHGHILTLPAFEGGEGKTIEIGTLGTGRRKEIKVTGTLTDLMAQMLTAIKRPIYLMDTRRTGQGGSGSWGPKEWASQIPAMIANAHPYDFLHLSLLAPSLNLLEKSKKGMDWEEFREEYHREMTPEKVRVAQAFVEAAAQKGGIALFLCAEGFHPSFDSLSKEEQNHYHCHRFMLARRVADLVCQDYPEITVKRVDLDIAEFWRAKGAKRLYLPSKKAM